MRIRILFLLNVVILSFGCSPTILDGTYSTVLPEEGILLGGDSFFFYDNNQVSVKHWSDDISSNKVGEGTFTVKGKSLNILFKDIKMYDPILTETVIESKNQDMSSYIFNIVGDELKPLIGVNVVASDSNGKDLNFTISNPYGSAKLELPSNKENITVTFSYVGFGEVVYSTNNQSSKVITLQMPPIRQEYKSGESLNIM